MEHNSNIFIDRQKRLDDRFIELYIEGFRPGYILKIISEEFSLSTHTLYKLLKTKDLKNKVNNT